MLNWSALAEMTHGNFWKKTPIWMVQTAKSSAVALPVPSENTCPSGQDNGLTWSIVNRSVVKNLLWDIGAATLVTLLPLVIYLKHHDYPQKNPESILLLAMIVLAGLFWGGVMSLGRIPGLTPGYDRRQLPIGHLFKRLMRYGVDPGDPDWEFRPRILLIDDVNPLLEVTCHFSIMGFLRKMKKNAEGRSPK